MTGYVYDAAGNVVTDFQNCYAYDAENHLSSVAPVAPGGRSCGGITMSYLYDPDGRRVARLQNGAMVKQDYYDSAGIEIAETDGNGNLLRAEIYAGSRHLATWTNNATYFNHADGLGTERVRTFTSGQYAGKACETITSLPFGDGLATQPANGGCGDPSPDHFTGLERDAESGLDHTLNRQFASSYGRWLTPDPASVKAITLADPQTWNMYEYAHNNPTTVTDPSGLGSPVDLGFAGGGGEGAPPDPFAEYHVIGIPPDNDPVRKPAGEKPHDQPFNPIITYDRNLSPAELAAAKTKVEGAVGLVNSKWGSLSEAQQRTLKQLAGIHVFTGRRGGMDFKAMTLNLSFGDNVNESSLARLGSDIAHDSFHITQYFNGQYMTHDKKALLRNESQAVHFQIPVCQALGCTKQEIRDLRHFEAHPEEGWGWWAQ